MGSVAKHVFLVTDATRLEATVRTAFEIARTGVDTELAAVTAEAAQPQTVLAPEIVEVVSDRSGSGTATYRNYAGVPVVGYYEWEPSLQAAVVPEVSQSAVFSRSLAAVLASGLVGLITIVIAGTAVLAASRAITEPITSLAGTAEQFAAGQLSARAASGRDDEVGRLADSFNSMAAQLQGTVASLEQRVAERTRALELQTLRLGLAHALGLKVTAVGVESEAQREALKACGCDFLQGFLLGRPSAAD